MRTSPYKPLCNEAVEKMVVEMLEELSAQKGVRRKMTLERWMQEAYNLGIQEAR